MSKRWQFSAKFVIASGTPATRYTDRVEWQGYVYGHNTTARRNNFRLAPYHRLDISATLQNKKKEGKRWESYWVFSIYNLYARRNPFSIFFQQQEVRPVIGAPIQTQAIQFSVLGSIVPSVSYNFKF
jgi:hypothetical protein